MLCMVYGVCDCVTAMDDKRSFTNQFRDLFLEITLNEGLHANGCSKMSPSTVIDTPVSLKRVAAPSLSVFDNKPCF